VMHTLLTVMHTLLLTVMHTLLLTVMHTLLLTVMHTLLPFQFPSIFDTIIICCQG